MGNIILINSGGKSNNSTKGSTLRLRSSPSGILLPPGVEMPQEIPSDGFLSRMHCETKLGKTFAALTLAATILFYTQPLFANITNHSQKSPPNQEQPISDQIQGPPTFDQTQEQSSDNEQISSQDQISDSEQSIMSGRELLELSVQSLNFFDLDDPGQKKTFDAFINVLDPESPQSKIIFEVPKDSKFVTDFGNTSYARAFLSNAEDVKPEIMDARAAFYHVLVALGLFDIFNVTPTDAFGKITLYWSNGEVGYLKIINLAKQEGRTYPVLDVEKAMEYYNAVNGFANEFANTGSSKQFVNADSSSDPSADSSEYVQPEILKVPDTNSDTNVVIDSVDYDRLYKITHDAQVLRDQDIPYFIDVITKGGMYPIPVSSKYWNDPYAVAQRFENIIREAGLPMPSIEVESLDGKNIIGYVIVGDGEGEITNSEIAQWQKFIEVLEDSDLSSNDLEHIFAIINSRLSSLESRVQLLEDNVLLHEFNLLDLKGDVYEFMELQDRNANENWRLSLTCDGLSYGVQLETSSFINLFSLIAGAGSDYNDNLMLSVGTGINFGGLEFRGIAFTTIGQDNSMVYSPVLRGEEQIVLQHVDGELGYYFPLDDGFVIARFVWLERISYPRHSEMYIGFERVTPNGLSLDIALGIRSSDRVPVGRFHFSKYFGNW